MTSEVWKAAAGYASPESDNDRPSDVDDVQTQRINDQLHSLGRCIFAPFGTFLLSVGDWLFMASCLQMDVHRARVRIKADPKRL
jgi:hypothetical protein